MAGVVSVGKVTVPFFPVSGRSPSNRRMCSAYRNYGQSRIDCRLSAMPQLNASLGWDFSTNDRHQQIRASLFGVHANPQRQRTRQIPSMNVWTFPQYQLAVWVLAVLNLSTNQVEGICLSCRARRRWPVLG